MALPAESGVIMHVSPCQPRSAIFATATVMPAFIFSALKPGGSEGSEKSTVSGFWPTNSIRVMLFLHAEWWWSDRRSTSLSERALAPKEFAGEVKCFARGMTVTGDPARRINFLEPLRQMAFAAPTFALSRTGNFHPGRTKWQVYPFGMRSR